MAIDWPDPCARAETLRSAYYRLLSGTQEMEVAYTANGVERRVKYSQGNLEILRTELAAAEQQCTGAYGSRCHTIRLSTSKGIP
jgi:hypothetical protein